MYYHSFFQQCCKVGIMFEIRNLQPHSRQAHTRPMAALLDSGGASTQKAGRPGVEGFALGTPSFLSSRRSREPTGSIHRHSSRLCQSSKMEPMACLGILANI